MIKQKILGKFLWTLFTCILLLNFILLINTKFTLWPEMMVYPYLLNNEFVLYKELINPYPPFATYVLSIIFGHFNYSILSYQLFTWLLVILTTILVFVLSFKLFKNYPLALASMFFFSFFSTLFGANGLWFDLIQTPLILISVFYFAKFTTDNRYSNLDKAFMFAVSAIFIKQQAAWLNIYYIVTLTLIYKIKVWPAIVHLPKTIILVIFAIGSHLIFLYWQGTVHDFVTWVLLFPMKSSSQEGYFSPPTIRQLAVILATFTLYVPILIKGKRLEKTLLSSAVMLTLFSYPRFDYFHLLPSFVILALIFGRNFYLLQKISFMQTVSVVMCFLFIAITTVRYITINWQKEVRFFESDIISAAALLSVIVPEDEKVYIQNGPDQVLALSGTLPPKPWADEFPWYLENNDTQERVISSLENNQPTFIVYKPYENKGEYMLGSYQPKKISNYIHNSYSNYFQISDTLWLKKKSTDL